MDDLQTAVQLIQRWLTVNEKSKDPVVAQSTKPDVSDGLQYMLESQRRVGSNASEGMIA